MAGAEDQPGEKGPWLGMGWAAEQWWATWGHTHRWGSRVRVEVSDNGELVRGRRSGRGA